jgi:hypothetical protein
MHTDPSRILILEEYSASSETHPLTDVALAHSAARIGRQLVYRLSLLDGALLSKLESTWR